MTPARGRPAKITKSTAASRTRPGRRIDTVPNQDPDLEGPLVQDEEGDEDESDGEGDVDGDVDVQRTGISSTATTMPPRDNIGSPIPHRSSPFSIHTPNGHHHHRRRRRPHLCRRRVVALSLSLSSLTALIATLLLLTSLFNHGF